MRISSKLAGLALPFFLILSLSLTSCASKKKPTATTDDSSKEADASSEGLSLELYGDSDSGKAGALKTVYFGYDSSEISSESKETLDSNAEFLKKNTNLKVQIEGHADERGSVQYNLALGERRAKTVKEYLVALGVASDRLSTISYGKERPLEVGHAEDAWSKNRRANFVISEK